MAREKITNALKEDILLRDRIAKLDKKDPANKEEKELDYLQKQEIARKKITDALREDILLRDRMAKADGMIGVDETKIKEKKKTSNSIINFLHLKQRCRDLLVVK